MDDKTSKLVTNYLKHAQRHISENKSDFSSFSTIYHKLIKKDNFDPTMDYTKEIVKRFEKDKMTAQTAQQITEYLMPEMKSMKNQVLVMAIPLILGAILMLIFGALLAFCRPFTLDNPQVTTYSIALFVSTIVFGFGFFQRTKVQLNTVSKTMLFHAGTAYGAAKMQGQGSFGAFRFLDEMKSKQGKEMQVRVTKPQIVYKR